MKLNPLDLTGKHFLITGAASGIGRTTSIILSMLGAKLILVDMNESGLLETKEKCNNPVALVPCDLTNFDQTRKKILAEVMNSGKLNGFAHIAGKPSIVPLKAINQKISTDIFLINTYAAVEVAKIFSSHNVYFGGSGSIVFISSVYGLVGTSANLPYAMSKAALHGATKSLAIELAAKGIRVNCIAPGFIDTEMKQQTDNLFNEEHHNLIKSLHPLGLGAPEDVAYTIAFLFSDISKWITGSILSVDGGFTAQ